MRGRATATAATLACVCAGVAAGATSAADEPVRKKVEVADNFFSPKKLSVPKGSTIVWKWSNLNAETHDVYLARKPKGVKRFQSAPAATYYSFKRKLRKPGKYRILCTFHEDMAMRITVRQ
jgi:plastocyanin